MFQLKSPSFLIYLFARISLVKHSGIFHLCRNEMWCFFVVVFFYFPKLKQLRELGIHWPQRAHCTWTYKEVQRGVLVFLKLFQLSAEILVLLSRFNLACLLHFLSKEAITKMPLRGHWGQTHPVLAAWSRCVFLGQTLPVLAAWSRCVSLGFLLKPECPVKHKNGLESVYFARSLGIGPHF